MKRLGGMVFIEMSGNCIVLSSDFGLVGRALLLRKPSGLDIDSPARNRAIPTQQTVVCDHFFLMLHGGCVAGAVAKAVDDGRDIDIFFTARLAIL